MIIAEPGGKEIDRILGFMEPREFIKTVNDYHQGIGTLAALMAAEKEGDNQTNPEFLLTLGKKLLSYADYKLADQRFQGTVVLDPKNKSGIVDDAMYQRVMVFRKLENWDEGIGVCVDLADRFPESEWVDDAAAYISYFHEKAGRIDEAIASHKAYLAKWPEGDDAEWAAEKIEALTKQKKEGSKP